MKFKRTERIGAIVKILSDNPNKIYTLSYFTETFNAAKSTISEDLLVVKNVFEKLQLGKVITISGAAGGVKYIPKTSIQENQNFLMELCEKISSPDRILSGRFLYLIDLIYDPTIVAKIGKIFASNIDYSDADYVVTMETKGIPMALMTAKAMNLPLVIIRKDIKVSEGPTLSMTYVTGDSSKVESMSLPRKAVKPGSKVILIDDFMRGGGTIKGMTQLMNEFGAEVIGTGVFITTSTPEKKLVEDYISLIEIDTIENEILVKPIIRKDIKVSEGPTLSMTYVTGDSSKVESMSLPRKAVKPGSKVILIDDFMRGGGTIKGMTQLMNEFGAEVIGTGVFITTSTPEKKLVEDYISLIEIDTIENEILVKPNLKTFKDEYRTEDVMDDLLDHIDDEIDE